MDPLPPAPGSWTPLVGAVWANFDPNGTAHDVLILEPAPPRFEHWEGRQLRDRLLLDPAEAAAVAARFDAGRTAEQITVEHQTFTCSSTLTLHHGSWRRELSVHSGVFDGGPIIDLLEALAARARRVPSG